MTTDSALETTCFIIFLFPGLGAGCSLHELPRRARPGCDQRSPGPHLDHTQAGSRIQPRAVGPRSLLLPLMAGPVLWCRGSPLPSPLLCQLVPTVGSSQCGTRLRAQDHGSDIPALLRPVFLFCFVYFLQCRGLNLRLCAELHSRPVFIYLSQSLAKLPREGSKL